MNFFRFSFAWLFLGFSLLPPATALIAQEVNVSAKRVESLIEGLVSKNTAPNENRIFPAAGYERQAQSCVLVFALKLAREDIDALRALLKHGDDMRYSISAATPFGFSHYTVGAFSRVIIRRVVMIDQRLSDSWLLRRVMPVDFEETWLQDAKASSVWDIQRAANVAQTQAAKNMRFSEGIKKNRHAQSLTAEEFAMMRQRLLDELERVGTELENSRQPIFPLNFDSSDEILWGFPWSPKETPWG